MVPLLYITIAFGIPALYTSVYHIKFELPAWQEQHEILEQEDSISSIRLGMMDSLFKKHRLAGMSRTEIKLLLGKPEAYSIMGYEYAYTLGIKNFFFPHTSVMGLGINFEDDVVVEMGAFVFL